MARLGGAAEKSFSFSHKTHTMLMTLCRTCGGTLSVWLSEADMTLVIVPKDLRQLTWKHFSKVKRPKEKGSDASTGFELSYVPNGGKALVTLKLDASNTWVIQGKMTDALLKHEQGHWDIYILQAEAVDRRLQGLDSKEMRATYVEITQDFGKINQRYDDETDHSRMIAKQEEWDCRLASAKRDHTLLLADICSP